MRGIDGSVSARPLIKCAVHHRLAGGVNRRRRQLLSRRSVGCHLDRERPSGGEPSRRCEQVQSRSARRSGGLGARRQRRRTLPRCLSPFGSDAAVMPLRAGLQVLLTANWGDLGDSGGWAVRSSKTLGHVGPQIPKVRWFDRLDGCCYRFRGQLFAGDAYGSREMARPRA